jgi:hypothetical protein
MKYVSNVSVTYFPEVRSSVSGKPRIPIWVLLRPEQRRTLRSLSSPETSNSSDLKESQNLVPKLVSFNSIPEKHILTRLLYLSGLFFVILLPQNRSWICTGLVSGGEMR